MPARPRQIVQPQAAGGRPVPWSARRCQGIEHRGEPGEPVRVALQVIAGCDRLHAADRVLVRVLRGGRYCPATCREVAQAVSGYFRWLGWLEPDLRRSEQLARAAELDERYLGQPDSFPVEQLVGRAVPPWTWEHVERDDGWLRSLQRRPVLWVRARPGQAETTAAALNTSRGRVPGVPEALMYGGQTDLYRLPLFRDGRLEIQDLSSQAVGRLCGAAPGERWWDVCAGEGGKTLHLSDLMQNRGQIWATDRAEWRLRQLRRRAARAGVSNYQYACWDGEGRAPVPFPCDGVLVDAPCTGLGTWGRNPHARWTTTPADVRELAAVQAKLLCLAASRVKPGGRLIYAVCTLTRLETVAVADQFDAGHSGFEPLAVVDPLRPGTSAPRLWLRPWALGGNGMFVAAWRRGT